MIAREERGQGGRKRELFYFVGNVVWLEAQKP
jgi:hypothetical protein